MDLLSGTTIILAFTKQPSPSPLRGEGWGGGENILPWRHTPPPPNPLPPGEGEDYADLFRKGICGA